MRIAYFNATLRIGQDGVTRVIHKMIEGALARDNEVIGFGALLPDRSIVPMVKVPSIVFPLHTAYRLALPGYRSFAKNLREFRPDIMHINSPCTLGFAAVKYAQRFRVPIVATYHTHFPTYLRYYRITALERLAWKLLQGLYNRVQRTFVPAMPILHELQTRGFSRLEYLPNGVDLDQFSPKHRSRTWRSRIGDPDKQFILFVSRLVWEKDLRVLADMYNLVRSHRDDFQMVVVGDGHARAELEAMMRGAHFVGYQTGAALSECYASSDIFVFPSTTESFGLVTLEAMASGLAPVAAKVGGAVEIIEEGGSGLFAEPLNASDLARKIEWLLDRPEERSRIAAKACQRAGLFGWQKILDRLFERYQEVIEGSGGKDRTESIL